LRQILGALVFGPKDSPHCEIMGNAGAAQPIASGALVQLNPGISFRTTMA